MENNVLCKIALVGIVRIRIFDRAIKIHTVVRHAPELKRNLISLSTHDSKRYRYTSKYGVLKVSRGALIIMNGQKSSSRLYILQGSTFKGMQQLVLFPWQMKKLQNFGICNFVI